MGIITDIQRFSLNDGPGIRTTVFFKGCNIACDWCHNPESISPKPELMRYGQKCIGCGRCEDAAAPCFSGARKWAGREVTVRNVMAEVMQDADYYITSGGGVTLSGGEPMLQPDFAAELLHACVGEGIQTAIETNLYYDFSILEKMLCDLTLIMCDMKVFDDKKHRKSTGAGNGLILENLRLLGRKDIRYVIRTPVIPGLNDSEEEICAIASFISQREQKPLYYELLNFNPLGAGKYEALGIVSKYAGTRPLSKGRMQELAEAASKHGITVRVG